jgi:DNA-binding NtrC family response regulator
MPDTLLVIEDEHLLRTELERHFRVEGWEVAAAGALDSARKLFREREVDPLVVLTDMSLPDGNALDLLEESREKRYLGEWVFLTGYGSVPDSVRALRLGAFDFLEKPCELERLDMVVAGAARSARAQRRLKEQAAAQSLKYSPSSFTGTSAAARSVRDMLEKLAEVPFSGLVIGGETGTGKGLAARILHHAGRRSEGPLVEVNCAAFPRDLLESELFGHEAGAFTGAKGLHRGLLERADQGTLFLDEVSEMPLELQVKLLRAIEERSFRRVGGEREIRVDVTIIAATNRDIEARVQEGSFRGDLYHRLRSSGSSFRRFAIGRRTSRPSFRCSSRSSTPSRGNRCAWCPRRPGDASSATTGPGTSGSLETRWSARSSSPRPSSSPTSGFNFGQGNPSSQHRRESKGIGYRFLSTAACRSTRWTATSSRPRSSETSTT